MLHPRIIPCLLIHKNGLVKTTRFTDPKYLGDPINAVKIFNEKEVDEIIVLDIDASVLKKEPDYKMIEALAVECRMPLCYGGGIKTVDQAKRIFSLGVEKIAISSIAVEDPEIVGRISEKIGNQSVVVALDIKKDIKTGRYLVVTYNAKQKTTIDPLEFAPYLQALGAGEILINSIDQDGVMQGFDLDLIRKIRDLVTIPTTVMGGAGSLDDIGNVIKEHGIIGVAAGSIFVFKGKFRAVLINYPTKTEKQLLIEKFFLSN